MNIETTHENITTYVKKHGPADSNKIGTSERRFLRNANVPLSLLRVTFELVQEFK